MIVECSQCHTRFKVGDDKIVPGGVKVRCSKCKTVFTVTKDSAAQGPLPPPAAARPPVPPAPPKAAAPAPAAPAPTAGKPSAPPLAGKVSPPTPPLSPFDAFGDIPDDIFASPTKVGPPPPPPVKPPTLPPPPAVPAASLADQIDLDSDLPPLPVAKGGPAAVPPPLKAPPAAVRPPTAPPRPASPPPLQPPAKPAVPAKPAAPSSKPPPVSPSMSPPVAPRPPPPPPPMAGGGEDLFGDLPPMAPPPAPAAGAAAMDDPFADLDRPGAPSRPAGALQDPFGGDGDVFGSPPAAVAAPARPAAPAPPAPGEDLFGDLGDPFAGLPAKAAPAGPAPAPPAAQVPAPADLGADLFPGAPPPAAAPAVPPPAAGAPAPGDDPFAALDSGPWTGAAPAGQDTVGHDPFGGASADGPDDGMELALDSDGKLTGKPPPPPPPPTHTIAPAPKAPAATPPARTAPPPMQPSVIEVPAKASVAYKVAFAVLSLVVILFLFIVYRSGGKPDLTRWSTYVEAFTGKAPEDAPAGELQAVRVSHTLFPNRHGYRLLVTWGEVQNGSRENARHLVVKTQLMSRDRQILTEATLPAGVVFSPLDLVAMEDPDSVVQAYRARLPEVAGRELAPAQALPFMAVLYAHPESLKDTFLRVEAVSSSDPNLGLPPLPPPAPEPSPATPEPAPSPKKGPKSPAPAAARPATPPASP